MHATRRQNQYDHRLRQLVHETQDIGIALGLGVPRLTANGWLRQVAPEVITLDILDIDAVGLKRPWPRTDPRV